MPPRLKLNTIKSEFVGRNVLLVDDSIVRGTTATEIVQMARDAGAKNVYICSAAPPIRYPNIYGIDIPTQHELVAYDRTEAEVAKKIGADWVMYQNMEDLEDAIKECVPEGVAPLTEFDSSCFTAKYVTGETLGDEYFQELHRLRNDNAQHGNGKEETVQLEAEAAKVEVSRRGSNTVCESMINDTSVKATEKDSCEPIVNP